MTTENPSGSTYVPTREDVDLVCEAFHFAGEVTIGSVPSDWWREATAVLTALHAAGRLLPTNGQDRIEYGAFKSFADGNGRSLMEVYDTRAAAQQLADAKPSYPYVDLRRCWVEMRTVTDFPDGRSWPGPWVAVDEGSGT